MQKKSSANRLFVQTIVYLFLAVWFVSPLFGQNKKDDNPKNEFGIWGGASPDSSTAFAIGNTKNARYGTIALRYARRFNNNDAVNLKYTFDAIPVSLLNYPNVRFVQTGANAFDVVQERRTGRAFGVAPLGLQINFRPRKKVQPFVNASGGFLYFNRAIPNELGTRFTFTADLGGGIEFKLKDKRALTVGYKYLHLSNGERGIINPGFDNNLFYLGYSFLK